MLLTELLGKLQENNIPFKINNKYFNDKNLKICGASLNSKYIKKDYIFFALPGNKTNGNCYIEEALRNGATVIFTSSPFFSIAAPVIEIPNITHYLTTLASIIYNVNTQNFYFIGVTGTNGKTTTTYAIEHVLNYCGIKCAKIGTIEYSAGDYTEKSILTTPDILTIYRILSEAKKRDINHIVMEMSSHSLVQERININNFKQAIFTNIGHDHLDYHKDFTEYLNAKAKLFRLMDKAGFAIINMDDKYGEFFANNSNSIVITYGTSDKADVRIMPERLDLYGSEFSLIHKGKDKKITTKLIGIHNISNITAAFITCSNILQTPPISIIEAISNFESPPGRLEKVNIKGYNVYIDYAHTPQALENALVTLRQLKNQAGKIICVFGCGGDRDRAKRPMMGATASKLSDIVIITSDNPRTEDPNNIIEEIRKGIPHHQNNCITYEQPDRKKAIEKAIELADENDIILIAGKGHEDYQIFQDTTIHFSDKEVVLELAS